MVVEVVVVVVGTAANVMAVSIHGVYHADFPRLMMMTCAHSKATLQRVKTHLAALTNLSTAPQ